MTDATRSDKRPPKLLADSSLKFKIALSSCVVLAVGAWLTPPAAQTKIAVPQERAAPLLEEQVQLRDVSHPFVGVQDAATPVRSYSVAIRLPPPRVTPGRNDYSEVVRPAEAIAGYGVFVSDMHVLTHSAALGGRSLVELATSSGRTVSARVASYELSTGLILLQLEGSEDSPRGTAPFAVQAPTTGELAVAVGRSGERELVVPVFVTSADADGYTIGALSDSLAPGMPVFNLSGELLSVVVPDGRAFRGLPVRQAAKRLLTRATAGAHPSSFGVGFQVPTDILANTFGREGVIISDVLSGGPADGAGLQVGDVLLAVGEQAIDSEATGVRALSTAPVDVPTTLRIRRNAVPIDIEVTPRSAYEVGALARSNANDSAGLEARALFPLTVLDASAIPPSARVLRVSGRPPRTRTQVQRELRLARQPVPVLIRDGNNQFFVTVEPTR